ncbi:hypothetical protein K4K49_002482 [Colletotrichum sp. SAR 10_70]|nr:hypothetical protein K4K50_002776 [Colletotrichum sp. SAR 10_71]KAI8175852.1 hypothetical protein K4K49_002482 [Colletotrichum sp. SAR 10_70]KAI8210682.1 hypothetical protein K4K52_011951 [Colletotrichum sp. SAR 10_76]KAI8228603.1 hypothetical protein K4K54_002103 [Colletotrichum sp. SAR 10_86]
MAEDANGSQRPKSLQSTKTPEPRVDQPATNGHDNISPGTPGPFPDFDWEEFEARYEKALADADEKERELLEQFEGLVKYFNIWASTSSAHDNERAVKRLRTRQRYVNMQEQNMAQKQEHSRAHFAVPNISNDELTSFFESHFSDAALQGFKSEFFSPEKHAGDENAAYDDEEYYEEEDDGLGYYPDGVKRTLTDEQIAMFRHSEIEALRKEKEKAAERRLAASQADLEAGEVGDNDSAKEAATPQPPKPKNKKKRKAGKNKNHEPKPDLRKRTWDVVEAGLDSLDYD